MNVILGGLSIDGTGYPASPEIFLVKQRDDHWQYPGHRLQHEWATTTARVRV